MKILLVEDNADDALLAKEGLSQIADRTFEVKWVENLSDAVERLKCLPFDVVLLDLKLPDGFGFEVYQAVKKYAGNIPCIILTGQEDDRIADQLLQEGAQDYINKAELTSSVLWRAIRYAIGRRHAETQVVENEKLFRLLAENSTDMISRHDLDGRFLYSSPACSFLLDFSTEELVGNHIQDMAHPDDRANVQKVFSRLKERQFSYRIRRKNEDYLWVETSTRLVKKPDGTHAEEIVAVTRDITKRKQFEEQLMHNALHDNLTELANRELLTSLINNTIALYKRNPQRSFALLYLDLDNFKGVNDSFGHKAGDELLLKFAKRLQDVFRPSDTFARLGGDEFAILLSDIESKDAVLRLAQRIQATLDEAFFIDNHRIFISASIGIVLSDERYSESIEMLRDADIAMYDAKRTKPGSFSLFDTEMHAKVLARMEIENSLRDHLRSDQLYLAYQPIYKLENLELTGFETLVRWRSAEHGFISPGVFIPIAEEAGLIQHIDAWVLTKACLQGKRWLDMFGTNIKQFKLSVNISSASFGAPEILYIISEALEISGFPPEYLCLEITETALLSDYDVVRDVFDKIKTMGVAISLDDFGTGYSSLSHIHTLSFDYIKIDQSFVRNLEAASTSSTIIRLILSLVRELDAQAVGEGIEEQRHVDFLKDHGCHFGQGYHFSKPLSVDDATSLLLGK